MKIAFILTPGAVYGGTFVQALADIELLKAAAPSADVEIFALNARPSDIPAAIDLPVHRLRFGPSDRLIATARSGGVVRRATTRFGVTGSVERQLMRSGVDLVVFSEPHWYCGALQALNYIVAVHDVCHRDFPEFPEATTFGRSQARDALLRTCLTRCIASFVDSDQLTLRLQSLYGFPTERCIARPFSASRELIEGRGVSFAELSGIYGLEKGYFFYPAQFWAHKNHIRLLQALLIMRSEHEWPRLVFVGDDKGNLAHVKEFVSKHKLGDQVRILGFVPVTHLRALYEGAAALVMPTYFGPTNIPPYEAWRLGTPVIYSRHLAAQVGDAALLADPDQPEDWAARMRDVRKPDVASGLIGSGFRRSRQMDQKRTEAEKKVTAVLAAFARRRETWPVPGSVR
jgi:glycosyltransferase involved in cell wall biosynthesis